MKKETKIFLLVISITLVIISSIAVVVERERQKEINEIYENIADGIRGTYEEEE